MDDVKNESIRNLYPQASPKSDKHDELMLNLTRQDVYEYIDYMWNDVHWLAALMMAMIFTGCLLTHHSDLRMRMYGAQMRIACCSMIYRKVSSALWMSTGIHLSLGVIYVHIFFFFFIQFCRDSGCQPYRQTKLAAAIWWICCRTMSVDWMLVSFLRILCGFYRFRWVTNQNQTAHIRMSK